MNAERHQEVMQILSEVMDCDTHERELRLADVRANNESLESEVQRLLDYERSAAEFLETPVWEEDPSVEIRLENSMIGACVGAYTFTKELGRGGMGVVYLAERHDQEYRQQVAIKLIRSGLEFEFASSRFRKERQILADLNHPNIARLIDGGTTTDGVPYLIMEYVDGLPIDKYADTKRLTTIERLELFRTICSAVHCAHLNFVIHRDIKPTNIIVNAEGVPKLLDFGIAKLLPPDASPNTSPTTAFPAMTPEYASPEQVRGEQVTNAADIYSLGVVLYELLTGRRPYHFRSKRLDEVARVISTQEPSKPSLAINQRQRVAADSEATSESVCERSHDQLERLRRTLRGDLDNIVLMALRREPERRYASVEQFSEDIRRYLSGLPIKARKDTLLYRSNKFFKRNRTFVVSTFTVALMCLLVGVFLTLFAVRAKSRASIAVLPFANSSNDPNMEYLSDGVTDNLIDNLSHVPHLRVPAHDSIFSYKGKAIDPQSAGRALGVETVLVGDVATDGDNVLIAANLFDSSNNQTIWNKQYSGKTSDVQKILQEMSQDVSRKLGLGLDSNNHQQFKMRGTTNGEAYNLYLRGIYFWSKRRPEMINKAIDLFHQALVIDPNYALADSGLANSYTLFGAYDTHDPELNFPPAKAAATKALEIDPTLPEGHNSLAIVTWLYDWDFPRAESEFKKAIELNPNYPLAHHWYGLFLGEMGRFDEAIAEEKRALELDPVSPYITADLGRVYYWARRYDEALEQFYRADDMGPPMGDYFVNLMDVYKQKGMTNELLRFESDPLKRALAQGGMNAYWEKLFGQSKNDKGFGRAEILAMVGKNGQAFEQLEVAYEQRDHLMTQLKVRPAFDGLRSDPRFVDLLRRMKLIE